MYMYTLVGICICIHVQSYMYVADLRRSGQVGEWMWLHNLSSAMKTAQALSTRSDFPASFVAETFYDFASPTNDADLKHVTVRPKRSLML